jgi:hypothetical protein
MNHLSSPKLRKHRFHILCLAAFAFVCTTAAIGCTSSSYSETTVQGVKVRINHPEAPPISSKHEGHGEPGKQYDKEVVSWAGAKPGRVEVVIEDLRLQVDGRDYGVVKAGDVVTVDITKQGAVAVNDQERQPVGKK